MRGITLLYTLLACSAAISADVNVCPDPENVNCEGRNIPPANDVPSKLYSAALQPAGTKEQKIISPNVLPNGCPDTNIHWLLPHETNCSKFYYCVWGDRVLRECAPGTHFNRNLQVCDWPQNANCLTPGPINPDPTPPESTTPQPTPTQPTEFLPNGCPVNPHIHWLLPHETKCSWFYYCVWGELVLRECAPGTHFNSVLQVCDWPQNANCAASEPTTLTPTTPVPTTAVPTTSDPITPEPSTPQPTTTQPTEFLPNGCPVNPHIHWLLPHETKCSWFYYCVWGELVLRECAPGTHFNSALQVCDWPQNANCAASETTTPTPTTAVATTAVPTTSDPITPEPSTPQPTTTQPTEFLPNGCPVNPHIHWLLPHETNCTLFYYCVWGDLVLRQCGPGTHFNSVLQVCDWPQNANCAASETTTPTPTTAVTTTAVPTTSDPITPEPTTSQPTTSQPTTSQPTEFLPNGCPVNPHIHWLLPHKTNCSLFYYCVWGDLVLRECPRSTHFNRVLQVCDWPQNANCAASEPTTPTPTTPVPTTAVPTTSDPITPEPTTPQPTTTQPTEFLPNGCPVNPHIHWLLPHETKCSWFYYCVWGELVLRECAPGTHFNSALQVCDWPQNANCAASETTTPTPTTAVTTTAVPTTSDPITPEPSTPQPTTTQPTEFLPNGCPVNPHIHWLLPHETNCTLFYYCVWGDLVLRQCGPGTHFNSVLQVCDWPQNANCAASETTTPTPTTAVTTTAVPTTSDPITPEPTTSQPTTSQPTTSQPTEFLPNGCPVNPHIHWLLPHKTNCSLFYYCVWGDLVLRECPRSTHFNRVLQVCDWPQNANCAASEPTTPTPTTPVPTTAVPTTSDPITPEPTTPQPTTTQPTEFLPNGCPVNPHIHWLLPHETKCSWFYYCVWGELVLRECAPDTHFNSVLQVCDWPQNANCAASEPTTLTPTTTVPTTAVPTTSDPITPEPTTPQPTTTQPTEFLPNGCPVNPHIHWLLPHETKCSWFYYCVWGELVLRECAPGTHFNSALQVCDWPQNVNCASSEPTTLNPTTPVPTAAVPTTSDPITPEPSTPQPTTTQPTEFLPNGCPVNPHIHWLLPHETNCTLFYYCVWGDLVLRQCGPGTHFNRVLQVCDWPRDAGCTTALNKHVKARRSLLSLN